MTPLKAQLLPSRALSQHSSGGQPWKPAGFQLRATRWLLEHGSGALFLDPGLRKTSCTYAALKVLRNEGLLDGALVLAPLRPAVSVWPQEREKWLEFQDLDVVVLHGAQKERLASERHEVYVVNYEGLAWLARSGHLNNWLRARWVDTLVLDELSKFKDTSTLRYKTLEKVLPRFRRRWGLTGSPAANGLMNLFGQCYVLDLGKALGPYITHYRSQFFTPAGEYTWILQQGADTLIYDRLRPLALRLAAKDYLELPRVVRTQIVVDLPSEARTVYDELERELVVHLENGEPLSAPSAGVLQNKLRQVASGAIFRNEYHPVTGTPLRRSGGSEWVVLHDAKLDALEDLIEELQGAQLLVGYEFKHDLARLQERFGGEVPYIGGGVSAARALQIERDWNAGRIPLMFGQPQSMGHGLNLQGSSAHHIAWFTLTWDYEMYDQFVRRLLRSGNNALRLFIYSFVCRGTVEQRVAQVLKGKSATQESLFQALTKYFAECSADRKILKKVRRK